MDLSRIASLSGQVVCLQTLKGINLYNLYGSRNLNHKTTFSSETQS